MQRFPRARAGTNPACTSCGESPLESTVTLCAACVAVDGVAAYCRGCGIRLRFTVGQARKLFAALGKAEHARPGVVMVFLERCALCRADSDPSLYPHRLLVAEFAHDTSVDN